MDLCNFHELKTKENENLSLLDRGYKKLKASLKALPRTMVFFLKILYTIKTNKKTASDFLLPNHDSNNNYLIPLS